MSNRSLAAFFEQQLSELSSFESYFISLSSEAGWMAQCPDLRIAIYQMANASLDRLETLKSVSQEFAPNTNPAVVFDRIENSKNGENRYGFKAFLDLDYPKNFLSNSNSQKLIDSKIARELRRLCMFRFSDYCTLLSTAENLDDAKMVTTLQPLLSKSGLEAELVGTLLDDELLEIDHQES